MHTPVHGQEPEPSGLEGLADVRIIRAIYRSLDQGHPVKLEPFETPQRPDKSQVRKKRATKRPPEAIDAPPETAPSS